MPQPSIVICPGIHPSHLTESFLTHTKDIIGDRKYLVYSSSQSPPYSGIAISRWLKKHYSNPKDAPPLSIIAFSAGVVGAITAAWGWQWQGGTINSFVAFDGWGMPLGGSFPIYRISHDYFTHWSSALLGGGEQGFYADPAVQHWDIWRSPHTCQGWQTIHPHIQHSYSLLEYLNRIL